MPAAAPDGPTDAHLLPVIRRVLGTADAKLGPWQATPLSGGLFSPPLRCTGTAETDHRHLQWTCVAKRANPSDIEAELYRSGALAALPGPLRAPVCYAVHNDGDDAWIWLEHVVDDTPGPWPPERMALAARHLGATQGPLLNRPPTFDPPSPPLDHTLDTLIAGPLREAAASDALWSLPPFAALARQGGRDRLHALQARWPALRAALAVVPRVLCHGDCHRHNLCAAHAPAGTAITVALDWQMATWGWLGHDVVGLAFGTIPEAEALLLPSFAALEAQLLQAYTSGLRDAGWRGDPRLAELGYLTSTIHRARLQHILSLATDPQKPPSAVVTRLGGREAMTRFICMRAEIALSRLERAYRLAAHLRG